MGLRSRRCCVNYLCLGYQ